MLPTSKASYRAVQGPTVTITGRRAIESGAPIFVRRLDGRWIPGDAATRERGQAMLARGAEHAVWIYGIEG